MASINFVSVECGVQEKEREREKEREKCKTFCKCTHVASTNGVSVVTSQTQDSFLGVFSERECVLIRA